MTHAWVRSAWAVGLVGLAMCEAPAGADEARVTVQVQDGVTVLLLDGTAFHDTEASVEGLREMALPGSLGLAALWDEVSGAGRRPFYAISLDGARMARVRATAYDLRLRYAGFDPLVGEPAVPANLAAGSENRLYLVQFVTQPLDEYRDALQAAGATVRKFIANHAHIVEMDAATRDAVAAMPFVRWLGTYHPAYRVDEETLQWLGGVGADVEALRFNIMVFEKGLVQKRVVAERIKALGGTLHMMTPNGFRLEATLTAAQLLDIVQMNEVQFVDRWGPPSVDMDLAREIGGANYIEGLEGFSGEGVRAEIFDTNVSTTHPDFQATPTLFHGSHSGDATHGTSTYGILFGDGTNDPEARGLIPDGQGIFADFELMTDRYAHTAELLADPYFAILQSNSWGDTWTSQYTTISAEMDTIIFDMDIVITNSMSNLGNTQVRPQAWAKNIVSVGGVNHENTLDRGDDNWSNSASIGPAADGRVKPDLIHFYDSIFTTISPNGYTQFCCTSGATPIVGGHLALFIQMWSEGVFGNEPTGSTVFENRPHCTLPKAMLVNTAYRYDFSGTSHDLTRTHQGWGMPDLKVLYDTRENMFWVNEEDVLTNLTQKDYLIDVQPGEPELRVTMVYLDLPGVPASQVHRINDLTLKVVSPTSVTYYGNNGLLEGNVSTSGGEPNTVDTVENVFVPNPEAGTWRVTVLADEINEDAHVETGDIDADFSLVVTGGTRLILAGDCDTDGDIEGTDFATTADCLSGPDSPAGDPSCSCSDFDGDLDVDLVDLGAFWRTFDCVAPAIISAPQGAMACVGERVVLSVAATGNVPLQYQWFLNDVEIDGATGSSYVIDPYDVTDEGTYTVTVTNDCGTQTSTSATLTSCFIQFVDDFESDLGWTVVSDPGMLRGFWQRGLPKETVDGANIAQPGEDNPAGEGSVCYVTGPQGGLVGNADVDGGPTELVSPVLDLTGHTTVTLDYAYWVYRGNTDGDDHLLVSLSNDGGATWTDVAMHSDSNGAWTSISHDVGSVLPITSTMQLRFSITDTAGETILEALVDDVSFIATDE